MKTLLIIAVIYTVFSGFNFTTAMINHVFIKQIMSTNTNLSQVKYQFA